MMTITINKLGKISFSIKASLNNVIPWNLENKMLHDCFFLLCYYPYDTIRVVEVGILEVYSGVVVNRWFLLLKEGPYLCGIQTRTVCYSRIKCNSFLILNMVISFWSREIILVRSMSTWGIQRFSMGDVNMFDVHSYLL